MKIEKILMLTMIACCLLIASSIPVSAAEKTATLEDGPGDVVDYETQEIVTENQYIDVDNIDITKVEYMITDETIEFTLEVKGKIEDRGSLDELDPESIVFNIDSVTYTFELITSEDWYSISYANNTCQISDSLGATNLTDSDFSVSGNTLTVSFDWNTTGETFEEASANVQYIRMILDYEDILNMDDPDELDEFAIIWLADQVPNGPLFVYADADTNLGEVGTSIEFEGTAVDGLPPYTYHWDFGDGETSTELDTTHIYDEAGEYEYTLTVTDSGDGNESFSGSIEIVGDDDNGTPGFELIIAITAIGLIFLWKRKR